MKTILQIMADGLVGREKTVMLIGGHALPAYGIMRQTADVDCLVAEPEIGILEEMLINAGYAKKRQTEACVRYIHRSPGMMDVDILVLDKDTFGKMMARGVLYRIGTAVFYVPCLEHFIALKLHAMKNASQREPRDLADIVELLRANPGKVTDDDLRAICDRYGPTGIYVKVEKYL